MCNNKLRYIHQIFLLGCFRWYPPGHGDFYQAFHNSGLLDELIEKEGRSVCFMSNIDNMGATVDLSILKQCIESQNEFIMEVSKFICSDNSFKIRVLFE